MKKIFQNAITILSLIILTNCSSDDEPSTPTNGNFPDSPVQVEGFSRINVQHDVVFYITQGTSTTIYAENPSISGEFSIENSTLNIRNNATGTIVHVTTPVLEEVIGVDRIEVHLDTLRSLENQDLTITLNHDAKITAHRIVTNDFNVIASERFEIGVDTLMAINADVATGHDAQVRLEGIQDASNADNVIESLYLHKFQGNDRLAFNQGTLKTGPVISKVTNIVSGHDTKAYAYVTEELKGNTGDRSIITYKGSGNATITVGDGGSVHPVN
ncbi:DUF2807 domain-containing protein [Flammeovirga yaeyamensis]|uniref:DUF2807 domain-containing protein n=1 Tax=Flammeovirga yaeyamensis TaxID=367791 RepID=A0AAX1N5P8_9BACT|nr:DUF2807 domain-containing protein [Flammeovirga yaeyamensis]MBB3698083.1 hypothetical protein [Flammeovirga yaeyamensis]NMF34558.1 hypothetical protein [Flammeovirga yaeyamensis]QWG01535.1 DUF2807 domain-containing protein [Flammeovirga yaeyamensis]